MGLIRITADMSETERIAAYNSNMQYLKNDLPLELLPIGTTLIFYSSAVNPNDIYGGTWERTAKGKAIVGVDEDDEDFATAGLTLGEKKHQTTTEEMPSHTHQLTLDGYGSDTASGVKWTSGTNMGKYAYGGDMIEVVGGNQPHNNIQPSMTFYIWTRVA